MPSLDEVPARLKRGLVEDLTRLHEVWMELVFPRQRTYHRSVLGKWRPTTGIDRAKYYSWGMIGIAVLTVLYPALILGLVTRTTTQQLDAGVESLGLVGAGAVLTVAWGGVAALATVAMPARVGYYVVGACLLGLGSAGLIVWIAGARRSPSAALLLYPAGVTSVLLPPLAMLLFSGQVGGWVFPRDAAIAEVLLNNLARAVGAERLLGQGPVLRGAVYALLWIVVALPAGVALERLVGFADTIRPEQAADPLS